MKNDFPHPEWLGKPYYSLDAYCKNTFQHKCYKIALDAHMTCPNRDGTAGSRGCLFCSAGGSGEFAASGATIQQQLEEGLSLFGEKQIGDHYIAYFQAYTNTYAPVERLRTLYTQALDHPKVCGISIATRPDCLPQPVLDLLTELRQTYPDKFIWIELGLQTIHEDTALLIRRGYPISCFAEAVDALRQCQLPFIVHVILGLPGEDASRCYDTIRYLNGIAPFGIKLQLLHVLTGTDLEDLYARGKFEVMTKEGYLDLLIHALELLSPDIVIHRLTGDGPRKLLLAPEWSLNKRDVLNTLHKLMWERNTWQGRLYLSE